MKCDDRDELWVYFGNPAQNMFDLFALFQM